MFKYVKAFFSGLYKILFAYPKIRRYAKHKDKYPIEVRYAYARKLVAILINSFKAEIITEGFEKIDMEDTFMVVGNHQGMMDALLMMHLFEKPMAFVSKIETKDYPFAGKVNESIDAIFIDRDNIRDAVKMVKTCREHLLNGRSVGIFPEGTRTKDVDRMPGEYKAGALKPVYEAKKKLVVLAIDGGYKVFSKKFKKKPIIKVKVVDIVDPSVYETKKTTELAKEIQDKTREAIIQMRKQ